MTSTVASSRRPRWFRLDLRASAQHLFLVAVLLLLGLLGATITARFATISNMLNILEQSTDLALVSLGQTLTVLTGGIDLSVGSMISLLACLMSGLINNDPSLVIPVCTGVIVLGTAIGLLNGCGVVLLRVHPLIVTLGMGAVLQGVVLLYTRQPVGGVPDSFQDIAYGRIAGCPVGTIGVVILFALVSLVLRRTGFGRAVYATGDDATAATLLGLPVSGVRLFVYAASGFFCGLTALFLVARFGAGQPYAGTNYTLASVTPVVVGGTLLSGGRGGVLGTFLGCLLIGTLNDLLNFLHVSSQAQLILQGLIIMASVSLYVEQRRGLA